MLRRLTLTLGALCVLATPLAAETLQDQLAAQLRAQGYHSITTSSTWLGRLRIVALIDGARREIVMNPYTGEILRDYQGPEILTAGGGSRGTTRDVASAAADTAASTVVRDVQDIVKQEALSDPARDGGSTEAAGE
ncbi:MAG TPA: hypothetical protein DC061_05405 [Gemmobacter sp.]|nr:MAG: hypothetical protein A2X69_08295 [Rhodobacteraceae bacterium GWF1_65_7]HBD90065.1 hypothetical protein [Gemmobacter sp.]